MIKVFLADKIVDIRLARSRGAAAIMIPRQLVALDCMFKALGYRVCSLYLILGEPRDHEVIGAASRGIIRDLMWDFSVLAGGQDLVRVSLRYPLYKNLYRLAKSYGSIYSYVASQYLEKGKADVDLAIAISAERHGFKVDGQWIYREKPLKIGFRLRSDWVKADSIVEGLKKPLEEYLNPLGRVVRSVEVEAAQDLLPPESLVEAVEGRVISYDRIRDRLLRLKLSNTHGKAISKILGAISSSKVVIDKESGVKMVVKRFSEYTSTKWLLISPTVDMMNLIGIRPKALPSTRFWNEYRYSIELRRYGVKTPRILYIDPWSLTMIREYIEGEPLSAYIAEGERVGEAVEIFMKAISEIHRRGLCMVDTKPDNFVVAGDGYVYYVDLEQVESCRKPSHMAWDIAVFSYFTALAVPSSVLEGLPGIFGEKIYTYLDRLGHDGEFKRAIVKSLSDPRLTPIFILSLSVVNPLRLKTLVDVFKKISAVSI